MRLSAKRRTQWSRFRYLHLHEATQLVFTPSGVVEVVRLGQGEPIVLVPGLAGGWPLVAPLAQRLARDHEVILMGLRGDRGPLTTARAEGMADLARDLADVIGQLRLERPTVFGVSFGGAVALELAAERPGLLGALVLQGVEARFRMGLGATIAKSVLERFPLPTDNGFVNQFFNLLHGGKPESAPLADFVVERIWETDQGVMANRLRVLESFDVSDRLWRIDAPTLVLGGSRDVIVPPARQRALAEAIPGARFASLEGAGHIGFLTHGAEIRQQVGQLLRQAQRSPL